MNDINIENIVVIEIKTASAMASFDHLNEQWKVLWREKTKNRHPEIDAAALYQSKSGTMAEFSKIVCVCVGYFDNKPTRLFKIKSFYGYEEKCILNDIVFFLDKIADEKKGFSFVGHNIKEFDIPFISRRLLVNGIKIPKYLDFQNMKPWEMNIVDTFQYWRFGEYNNFTSLKLLANVLKVPFYDEGIEDKNTGLFFWEVAPIQRELNILKIAEYAAKNVTTIVNILLRCSQKEMLNNSDIVYPF